jgi:hypothetical protein
MAKRRSRARVAKKLGRRKFRARTGFSATKPVAVAALAQQSVRVVNIIPESLSGESNQDSEPSLAVNPANPLQMAASAFTPALSGNAPIFVSVDGGNTWLLNAIVPSDRMTADITVSFAGKSTTLYAGTIPQPIIDNTPGLNILRTDNFLGPTKMKILVDRRGSGVDQPYIAATTIDTGQTSKDLVAVGANDFNDPNGQTAVFDVSNNAGAANPGFKTIRVDKRRPPPGGADAPSIRPAIQSDGTIYGAFLALVGGTNLANLRRDVVVVRDDNFGTGQNPFTALRDPGDNTPGRRVAQSRLVPFLPMGSFDPPPIGQERIGSHIAIAVDPRAGQSSVVYLAWADRVGTTDYTIHLRSSLDRGVTWSTNDLLSIANAVNPALAINSDGIVGFLYQQLTGPFTPGVVTAANRWVTHFRRSSDGVNWNDLVLATTPASEPPGQGLPYLGDYLHLLAIEKDFYGIFSANNTPDMANFPNGVTFQRNHDFDQKKLIDIDGVTPVDISIDPFFFTVSG